MSFTNIYVRRKDSCNVPKSNFIQRIALIVKEIEMKSFLKRVDSSQTLLHEVRSENNQNDTKIQTYFQNYLST